MRTESMHRGMMVLAIALVVLSVVVTVMQAAHEGPRSGEQTTRSLVSRGSTACGVKRWGVKGGRNRAVKKGNLSRVISTVIPAPRVLPSRSRSSRNGAACAAWRT